MERLLYRLKKSVPLILVLAFVLFLPLFMDSPFYLSLLITAGVWAVGAMGWAAIHRTGLVSLGQASFMAIGAYTAVLLGENLGLSFWPGLALGGVAAAIFAAIIGVIVLRLGGMYFAVVSLALNEAVRVAATSWVSFTNGNPGIHPDIPGAIQIGTLTMDFAASKVPYYYLILIILIIAALVYWRLDRSRIGRISQCIETSEILSQHIGMHIMKYRVIIFTVTGFFGGIVGAYYAHFLVFMNPDIFRVWESIMMSVMSVIGGVNSAVAGPIIGALVVSGFGDYLTTLLAGLKPLAFGIMMILVLFFLPNGLVQLKDYFIRLLATGIGRLKPAGSTRS